MNRVVLHQTEIDALLRSPEMARALLEVAQPVVRDARVGAPKRTGAGAASIHAEDFLDGNVQTARISWDRNHFYMYFHNQGTRVLPARTFLEDALEAHTR